MTHFIKVMLIHIFLLFKLFLDEIEFLSGSFDLLYLTSLANKLGTHSFNFDLGVTKNLLHEKFSVANFTDFSRFKIFVLRKDSRFVATLRAK